MRKNIQIVVAALILAVAGGGCYQPISYADPVHRGVIGAAGGAVAGSILGGSRGAAAGAVIGGLVGAGTAPIPYGAYYPPPLPPAYYGYGY